MVQELFNQLRNYFSAKEKPTEEEVDFLKRLSEGYFPITSVHRDDLQAKGFDVDKITDAQMEELADKMGDDYCEQLFWDSMEIIADSMGLPRKEILRCPKCQSETVKYDINDGLYHCGDCSMVWDDGLFVKTEFPEDTSCFEEEGIGFPCWNSEDNGARYVPVWEYIRKFGKSPNPEKCYRAICWPDSQEYIGNEECELIQDEEALEKFGSSAYWVPARYKNGKV